MRLCLLAVIAGLVTGVLGGAFRWCLNHLDRWRVEMLDWSAGLGVPGWLVPIEQVQDGTGTPVDPDRYVADLAAALTEAVSDPARARQRGEAGRQRAVAEFSWTSIAERTLEVYRSVV